MIVDRCRGFDEPTDLVDVDVFANNPLGDYEADLVTLDSDHRSKVRTPDEPSKNCSPNMNLKFENNILNAGLRKVYRTKKKCGHYHC